MNARRLSIASPKAQDTAPYQVELTMSALGQKQTCAAQKVMSALPLIATVKADIALQDACSSRQQQRSTNYARRCKPRHTHT